MLEFSMNILKRVNVWILTKLTCTKRFHIECLKCIPEIEENAKLCEKRGGNNNDNRNNNNNNDYNHNK